ncbi:hypothetical protein OG738_29200 [Amycolatopsis sp. NBC_01488]|uniref:hypothetical protein n=1 Tax=Amycolatopsis sp. NBC_01488 TaxID=2903563 RepID=UPI002E2A116A|nr:hypothetical protein [Amycolatopsis sp. NBC_01488]
MPTPLATNGLWSAFQPATSLCVTTNRGDGVVRHDALADRWVISQFAFNVDSSNNPIAPFHQCIAVSKTADPVTGGWYLYDFLVSNQRFNDYPKMGIWPDGYYFTFNWNGDAGPGGVYAFDRANMLNGNPAGFVCFGCDTGLGLNNGDGFSHLGSDNQLLPADLDGATLPAFGAPETITRFTGGNTLRSFRDARRLAGSRELDDHPAARRDPSRTSTRACRGSRNRTPHRLSIRCRTG